MSTDETLWWQEHGQALDNPEAQAPEPPSRWGRKRKAVTGAAVAAGVALAGGVAIAATNNNGTSSTTQISQNAPGAIQGGQGNLGTTGGGGGPPGVGLGSTLHGEYVVETSTGVYATRVTQQGTVTAVSASELTVKSTDGFTKTYVVPSTVGVSSLSTGSTVNVVASVSGETATVTNVN